MPILVRRSSLKKFKGVTRDICLENAAVVPGGPRKSTGGGLGAKPSEKLEIKAYYLGKR